MTRQPIQTSAHSLCNFMIQGGIIKCISALISSFHPIVPLPGAWVTCWVSPSSVWPWPLPSGLAWDPRHWCRPERPRAFLGTPEIWMKRASWSRLALPPIMPQRCPVPTIAATRFAPSARTLSPLAERYRVREMPRPGAIIDTKRGAPGSPRAMLSNARAPGCCVRGALSLIQPQPHEIRLCSDRWPTQCR